MVFRKFKLIYIFLINYVQSSRNLLHVFNVCVVQCFLIPGQRTRFSKSKSWKMYTIKQCNDNKKQHISTIQFCRCKILSQTPNRSWVKTNITDKPSVADRRRLLNMSPICIKPKFPRPVCRCYTVGFDSLLR